jgi:hypothetical protein
LDGDRCVVIADDGIVAERCDHPRAAGGCEPGQGRNIEVIVVGMGDQYNIDRRQIREGCARIVYPLWPDSAKRRYALRPDRVEQQIQSGGLNEPARMTHIRDAPRRVFDPRRWMIDIRRRRPRRPFCARTVPAASNHPAQQVDTAARRRARRIEEAHAVEVIGYRPSVVARSRGRIVALA